MYSQAAGVEMIGIRSENSLEGGLTFKEGFSS